MTDPGTPEQVDGSIEDGNDRGFVQWTSGVLTGGTWMIVTIVEYGGTPSSYPDKVLGHGWF